MVDVPNGAVKNLRRMDVNIADIDVCLITHFHGDHYFDIPFMLLEQGLRNKRENDFNIVGPSSVEEYVFNLFNMAYPDQWDRIAEGSRVKFLPLRANEFQSVCINGYEINSVPVKHDGLEAYGYCVTKDGKTIGISGDSELCDGVEWIARVSDLAVVDTSFLKARSGHMGVDDMAYLVRAYGSIGKTFVATHMSDEVQSIDTDEFIVPKDGSVFNV
ncbi:MBL fold metallo-hydrolase [Rhodobium gokarnense]|uniref:Ribonuclease BN (tRNA processing enzyme) n=1 Tax=Rhodobium gokarnense TaxID=364296 RepID=A0ABT3HAG0_9HYPH|nr:MBL fold metallo-hydrolase [Rhodobium gokarnense]MCW2307386.1 ribonuclease BN (tRNA processing enzyme) [Rhodobium gokarnense]